MSDSPHSSLATPTNAVLPPRAPPSPTDSDLSTTNNRPNIDGLRSIPLSPSSPIALSRSGYPSASFSPVNHHSSSPSSTSAASSSPGSSSTSASVSFTLAPVSPTSLSIARFSSPFSSAARGSPQQQLPASPAAAGRSNDSSNENASGHIVTVPQQRDLPLTPSHSPPLSHYRSPFTSPHSAARTRRHHDSGDAESVASSSDAQADALLKSLGFRSPTKSSLHSGSFFVASSLA